MGVMKCNRKGCENIMCTRYSDEFGYICDECFSELKSLEVKTMSDIKSFMQSMKTYSGVVFDIDDVFSSC